MRPSEQLSLEEASEIIIKQLVETNIKQLREALTTKLKTDARIEMY